MPATSRSGGRGDAGTVFVAGSTGRLGIRIVRELAAAGLRVRAGVRSQEKAENFEEILAQLGETVGPLSRQDAGRVKVVYCDLEDPDTIAPAIGNASRVVCAVGAAENEFTDFSAPRRIDYEATERLIETAAELRTVKQFVLVTSLGTGKFGLPAGKHRSFVASGIDATCCIQAFLLCQRAHNCCCLCASISTIGLSTYSLPACCSI
jgi:nucleoside-diphosphate-sugar epimerase